MEPTIVRARVGSGDSVVQIQVPEDGSPEQDVGIGRIMSFDGVAESVGAIAETMTRALEKVRPSEAEVEFGIDVGVEAGELTSLIVKGTGNATLTVRLKWERGTS